MMPSPSAYAVAFLSLILPFSAQAAGRSEAFLGTTFGMSPQEVRAAIAKHGAQLLSWEEYKTDPYKRLVNTSEFGPVFPDELTDAIRLYTPGIAMFDSKASIYFEFFGEQLAFVGVDFSPIARSSAALVVAAIEAKLRSRYQFSGRGESGDMPGAYALNFTSPGSTSRLWVNIVSEPKVISFSIANPAGEAERKRQAASRIEGRERAAFGPAKTP